MNTKTMISYFESELTPLQNKEIQEGIKNGLSKKQVMTYASKEYNFLQMEQLRLALEHQLDKTKMKYLYDSSLSYLTMKEIREKLENNEILDIKVSRKNVIHSFLIVSILLMFTLFVPVYSKPRLMLKEDSITLKQGESFNPMSYIQLYTGKGKLIIPSVVDTKKKGNQIVIYRLITDEKTIDKILLIHVV